MHRGEPARRDRIRIQARAGFVRVRTQLLNQVPGLAKALGTGGDAGRWPHRSAVLESIRNRIA